jgi:predicted esterase
VIGAADPHATPTVLRRGPNVEDARLTVLLIHGRGATAESILSIADALALTDIAYLAPQAANRMWYPHSFLTPIPQNEPHLSSALRAIAALVHDVVQHGVPASRVGLVGFSQGGCLALEFSARHARRYAAVAGLSAGLIGPPDTPRDYQGTFDGTPVFLGCSDTDSHIPLARVQESSDTFRRLGAHVDERIYPGMGHTISQDEIEALRAILSAPVPTR